MIISLSHCGVVIYGRPHQTPELHLLSFWPKGQSVYEHVSPRATGEEKVLQVGLPAVGRISLNPHAAGDRYHLIIEG